MLTLLLIGMLTLAFNIQPVKGEPTTIIVPDDYPTIQEAINAANLGDTIFVYNGTYYENVVVNKTLKLIGEDRNNTIIDGEENGIILCITANNVTVSNFTITKGHSDLCGVYVNSSNNLVEKNVITENNLGIQFYESYNNTVSSNFIIKNSRGIYMEHSEGNTFEGNNITINQYGGVFMKYSTHNLFRRNIIIKNWEGTGIMGLDCSFCIFDENVLMENFCGIDICGSCHVQCIGNTIVNNTYFGIRMEDYSDYTLIIRNNIIGHVDGVWTHVSRFNTIIKNVVTRNANGFYFYGSGGPAGGTLKNMLNHNDIINNTVGVHVWYADFSLFCRNNFVNNTMHVHSERSRNYWDDGVEGNYWSNYTGVDLDHDGIGDTEHVIDDYNQDDYPLMGMFSSYDVPPRYGEGLTVTIVSNSTISDFTVGRIIPIINFTHISSNVWNITSETRFIKFNVTGETGSGFCRVCIPKALMTSPYYIVINKGLIEPLHYNETLFDNGTHQWIYLAYSHSIVYQLMIAGQEDVTPPVIANVTQQPTKDNVYPGDKVMVYANTTDEQSGMKQVTLNYTTDNGTWITVEMTNLEGNIWNATIPAFPYCTYVNYTIIAEDNIRHIITTKEIYGYEYQYHVIPEFPAFMILPLLMILLIVAILGKRYIKHKP